MSTNLHELTKQLDVLTYNSRSVLNALIRSVMASGSSSGWTVKRANKTIILTRSDIFMLSSFYTEWEYAGYDENKFYPLLEKLDVQFSGKADVGITPVTDAVVKHSQIMTMNSSNADNNDKNFWLDKVAKNVNPKLFTNTAPIPVNIRTPIYDENLSTKHFDQVETYLFPRGYYSMDILGSSGDETYHSAGGKEWFFDIDDKFIVSADRTVIGIQNPDVAAKREANYLTMGPLYSFAGGVDSYAFGLNSVAYGDRNQAVGNNAVAIGGSYDFAYGKGNGILGGNLNTTVLQYGAIGGGDSNTVAGQSGFAANSNNSVGGYAFPFVRYINEPNTGSDTECQPTYEPGDGCIYYRQDVTPADPTGTIGPNQILITNEDMIQAGFGRFDASTNKYVVKRTYISYAHQAEMYSYGDFKIGDTMCIYRTVMLGDTSGEINIGSVLERKITNVERREYGIVISFKDAVNKVPGYNGEVASGFVVKKFTSDMRILNYNSELVEVMDNYSATGSSTFGYNNIAAGPYQMSIGTSNAELLRPLFIVGNGSSYIDAHTFRHNAMVVAPNYSYMSTTSHYVFFGISNVTTATQYVHGDIDYDTYRMDDEDYVNYGIEKYKGVYAYSTYPEGDDNNRAVMRVCPDYTALAIGNNGIVMRPMPTETHENAYDVRFEASCPYGALSMNAGSWVYESSEQTPPEAEGSIDENWVPFYQNLVKRGQDDDKSMCLWAKDTVAIHGTGTEQRAGIYLHTGHYIQAEYGTLMLYGNSIGALCASTEDRRGIMDFKLGTPYEPQDPRFIMNPGYYMVDNDQFDPDWTNCKAWHVVSNSRLLQHDDNTDSDIFSSAKLIIPGDVQCNTAGRVNGTIPHIRVKSQNITRNSDDTLTVTDPSKYLDEKLAYLSDVDRVAYGYTGTPTYSIPMPAMGTIYRHICNVKFNGKPESVAGAMFAIAWRDTEITVGNTDNSFGGGEGILSVSMSKRTSTEPHARVVVLNNRTVDVSVPKSENFEILIRLNTNLEPDEYSFDLFTAAKYDDIYLASLRPICGACTVTYDEYDQPTVPANTCDPITLKPLDIVWYTLTMTAHT